MQKQRTNLSCGCPWRNVHPWQRPAPSVPNSKKRADTCQTFGIQLSSYTEPRARWYASAKPRASCSRLESRRHTMAENLSDIFEFTKPTLLTTGWGRAEGPLWHPQGYVTFV